MFKMFEGYVNRVESARLPTWRELTARICAEEASRCGRMGRFDSDAVDSDAVLRGVAMAAMTADAMLEWLEKQLDEDAIVIVKRGSKITIFTHETYCGNGGCTLPEAIKSAIEQSRSPQPDR